MAPAKETIGKALAPLGGGLGIDAATGNGLDVAEQAAGAVLRPIFGGLPWEMSAGEIVDSVTPDFVDAMAGGANAMLPYAGELLGGMPV